MVRHISGKRISTLLSDIFKSEYSFSSDRKSNRLTEARLGTEWIFQGNVEVEKGGLLISNSNSGCFIKPRFFRREWRDFKANIKIVFPKQEYSCGFCRTLGIVFRAQNFDDYFLLEVDCRNGYLAIRPHVRVGGNFDAPDLDADFNIRPLKINEDEEIRLQLDVKGNKAELYINNDEKKPLVWLFPDYVEPRLIQHTSGGAKDNSKTAITKVYFRDRAGMFGFRNYPNELALVKSLDIN